MRDTISILFQYLKTKHRNFETRDQLEEWQDKQVQRHLRWVKKNSSFYAKHWAGKDIADWRELPLVDKQVMMDNFNELNTVGLTKEKAFEIAFEAETSRDFSPTLNNVTIGLSSGTSGNRGIFLVSEKERHLWAGTILAKVLPRHLLSKEKNRVAFFLRANSNLYNTVDKGKVTFRFYDLLDSVDKHVESLNSYNPTLLVAPASMLRMLAEEKRKGALLCNPIKIVSVAEVLDPIDKTFIEKEFNQMVHQVYQCTEGFLAATCVHGTLHLNEDIVAIQKKYLDKDKRKFSPVITDFSRYSQPIIRYELNDILTEKKEPCVCGSVLTAIEQIEGRCDDIFYFESMTSGELYPVFPDFIRRAIISSSDKIQEYQVLQHSPEHIEVVLVVEESLEEIQEKVYQQLHTFTSTSFMKMPEVTFSQQIQKEQGRKLKRVERKFDM